jgi:hypothetical protein
VLQGVTRSGHDIDPVRAARMGGFGFCFYGPFQLHWYRFLDRMFPTNSLPNFASKVMLMPAVLLCYWVVDQSY